MPEADRRRDIDARLGADAWPRQPLKITAVDAATGTLVTFSDGDQVPLVDAVTASTAVPGIHPPATIRGRRYIDGGIRSCANADLAAGYERIVVLAPVARGSGPVASVVSQVRGLHGRYRVALVTPERTARRAMGINPSDPSRRPGAARTGYARGRALVPEVRDVWFSAAGVTTAPGA